MSDMSTYLTNALLNWHKGTDMPSAPTLQVSLWNGDPEGAGTEVTGTVNLTRQSVTWGSVTARSLSNSADVDFGTANGSATATYVALIDSSDNVLDKKAISSASISSGEKVLIAAGSLTLSG